MKVQDTKSIAGIKNTPPVTETKPVATGAPSVPERPEDKVTVDRAREALRQIEVAKNAAGASRSAKLREIEAAVRNGTYQPNPSRVAEEILSAAELDARIRAMFLK